jgi:hypothetical protein
MLLAGPGPGRTFLEQACPWVARNHLRRSHCRAVIDHDDLEQVTVQALRIQAAKTGFQTFGLIKVIARIMVSFNCSN